MSKESSPKPELPAFQQVEQEVAPPRCQACGAALVWDPESGLLHCAYCGATRPVDAAPGPPRELNLESGLQKVSQGFGSPMKSLHCQNCGADVALGENITATRCPFCQTPAVVLEKSAQQMIRPASLIPFRLSEKRAREGFQRWLARLWFRPRALKKTGATWFKGLYIPYWTFDALVDSEWTAQSGTYYYTTETYTTYVNGKATLATRQVRHVRWWPSSGQRQDFYDDILVCGSKSLPDHLVDHLNRFDTSHLITYHPHYLAGFFAERYALPLGEAHQQGQGIMIRSQQQRCGGDVPGDTWRNLSVSNAFCQETYKHILLPIWYLAYRFRGRIYHVLINGQNGEIEGQAPLSIVKILLAVLLSLALVGLVYVYLQQAS